MLLLTVAACSPAGLLNATVSADGISVTEGVAFMPGARGTLDVYRPEHPTGPLIVFLYGGSWKGGDKGMYPFVARPLAARGAVVVVPDYRVYANWGTRRQRTLHSGLTGGRSCATEVWVKKTKGCREATRP